MNGEMVSTNSLLQNKGVVQTHVDVCPLCVLCVCVCVCRCAEMNVKTPHTVHAMCASCLCVCVHIARKRVLLCLYAHCVPAFFLCRLQMSFDTLLEGSLTRCFAVCFTLLNIIMPPSCQGHTGSLDTLCYVKTAGTSAGDSSSLVQSQPGLCIASPLALPPCPFTSLTHLRTPPSLLYVCTSWH